MSKENFLIICLDSVRKESTSLGEYNNTPFISEVAENSVNYTRCVSPSSWSLPSHVSIFTGVEQPRHEFKPSDTLDVSKTFLADLPDDYDKYAMSSNPYVVEEEFGIADCFDYVYGVPETFDEQYLEGKEIGDNPNGLYYLDKFRSEVVGSEEPWITYINLMDAHVPYEPIEEYRGISGQEEMELQKKLGGKWDVEYYSGEREREELQKLHNAYLDATRQVDAIAEKIVKSLDKSSRKNTNIIITSDHGEGFGEKPLDNAPMSVGHGLGLFDSLLRVPLVVEPSGSRSSVEIDTPATMTNLGDYVRCTISNNGKPLEELTQEVIVSGRGQLQDSLINRWSKKIDVSQYVEPQVSAYSVKNGRRFQEMYWGTRKWVLSGNDIIEQKEESMPEFEDIDVTTSDGEEREMSPSVEDRLEALGYK